MRNKIFAIINLVLAVICFLDSYGFMWREIPDIPFYINPAEIFIFPIRDLGICIAAHVIMKTATNETSDYAKPYLIFALVLLALALSESIFCGVIYATSEIGEIGFGKLFYLIRGSVLKLIMSAIYFTVAFRARSYDRMLKKRNGLTDKQDI